MLSGLTRRFRIRAALTLAAIYAACAVAPAAALAFVDGPAAAHCLTEPHGMARSHDHGGAAHVHADGTMHHHDATHHHEDSGTTSDQANGDGRPHTPTCCGLFCMTALPGESAVALSTPVRFTFTTPPLDDHLTGRGPDRINRPPIA